MAEQRPTNICLRNHVQNQAVMLIDKIDPNLIIRSKWTNRHQPSYVNVDFLKLKAEIQNSGGNVQPIKVRPLPKQEGHFEIVFGHRRHQACLELGLLVLAMVEDMGEQDLFIQMERENRLRRDLRPYEQGQMYTRALDGGLFPSARKMAEAIGVDLSNLSKALQLARLPEVILESFSNRMDLQYRWANNLTAALLHDPDSVMAIAKKIRTESPRLDSKTVLKRLTTGGSTVPPPTKSTHQILGKGGERGSFCVDEANKTATLNLKNIAPDKAKDLFKIIGNFL